MMKEVFVLFSCSIKSIWKGNKTGQLSSKGKQWGLWEAADRLTITLNMINAKLEIHLSTEVSPYFSSMHTYTNAFFIKGLALIPLDVSHYKIPMFILNMTSHVYRSQLKVCGCLNDKLHSKKKWKQKSSSLWVIRFLTLLLLTRTFHRSL